MAISLTTGCTLQEGAQPEGAQSGSTELVSCGYFEKPNCFREAIAAVYAQCSPTADPDTEPPAVEQPDGVTCLYPSGNTVVLDQPLSGELASNSFNFTVNIDGKPCARRESSDDVTVITTPLGNIGMKSVWDPAVADGWTSEFSCPSGESVRIGDEALKDCDSELIPSVLITIGPTDWSTVIRPSEGGSLFRCAASSP